jgi:hypothetical protein
MIMLTYDEWARELMAQEGLTSWDGPGNSSFGDKRPYRTHWSWFAHAPQSDDLVGESNLAYIEDAFAGLDAEYGEDEDPDWFIGDIGHWTYSSHRTAFVRPYRADGVTPTEAGELAYELLSRMQNYPLLDESDYFEREWAQFETDMTEYILPDVFRSAGYDGADATDEAIRSRIEWRLFSRISENACRADDVADYVIDDAAEYAAIVRNRFYAIRGATILIRD